MTLTTDVGITLPRRLQTTRKIAKGRRAHFTGQFTFGPDEGRTMDAESNTELRVALVTTARPDVVDLENQVPFAWVKPDGTPGTHHFDFRVLMADGMRRAIMVKRKRRTLTMGSAGSGAQAFRSPIQTQKLCPAKTKVPRGKNLFPPHLVQSNFLIVSPAMMTISSFH